MNKSAGLADGARVVVSGDPTPEETAAVLLALDAARRSDAASRRRPAPAWLRAARREAIGGRLVASPADLR